MEEIIIANDVERFLQELIHTLYKKEYFGFEESAIKYVDKIYDFIYCELSDTKHRPTPKPLLKHGAYYVRYNAGKRTAWYAFFNKKDDRYIIKYITNNHVAKAAFLKDLN